MKRAPFSSLTFYTFARGKNGECLLKILSHCKNILQSDFKSSVRKYKI